MERCETCKHWLEAPPVAYELPKLGVCGAVIDLWDATEPNENNYITRTLRPEFATKLAFVEEADNNYAGLRTFPGFGCVQHAPK